ncbi:hypothetical protein EW026_g874 [Hermanssonia centrifuga]|uniref:Uncharacterized protein n=1 Tax=Hermanssonia centrifuga TaxID=98765 RepID=A0A4S4KTC1_9APHY|nr:hypothetical protein EW026_g874 [Hermanssonia centrifuga]
MLRLTSLCLASHLVHGAVAWGNLGHETVGYVAQEFLAPKALAFVQSSLGSTYDQSLGVAATWADTVKYETAYEWSAGLHFVDAEGKCDVVPKPKNAHSQLFYVYIRQPANVLFRFRNSRLWGRTMHITNLHAAWDTGILTKNVDANHGSSATTYASYLIGEIQSGSYASLTSSWLSCTSTTEPLSSKRASEPTIASDINSLLTARSEDATIKPLECPLVWAKEANAYDCSTVFPFTENSDACTGTYYTKAIPVIDLQLAKQGYRLAAWLNVIFDGSTNLS